MRSSPTPKEIKDAEALSSEHEKLLLEFIDILQSKDRARLLALKNRHNGWELNELLHVFVIELAKREMDEMVMFYCECMADRLNCAADLAGRIFGCANRGEMADSILAQGGILGAIFIYAAVGAFDRVEELALHDCPQDSTYPVAEDSDTNLMFPIQNRKKREAEHGYEMGGFFADKDKLLQLLSQTNDFSYRNYLANSLNIDRENTLSDLQTQYPEMKNGLFIQRGPVTDMSNMLHLAAELNNYINSHHFSFEQALQFHEAMKEIDDKHPAGIFARFIGAPQARMDAINAAITEIREPKLDQALSKHTH